MRLHTGSHGSHGLQGAPPADAAQPFPGVALRIANFALCQLAWFAAVLGAAHGLEAAGCVSVLAVIAWHLGQAERPAHESALLLIVTVLGVIVELAYARLGAFRYVGSPLLAGLPPLWLLLLWPLLGCMLNVSLRWLQGRYGLAAACGAVAGPLAFFGGARLGAAEVFDANTIWLAQAIGWAVLMPVFVAAARRFNGWAPANFARSRNPG